MPKKSKSSGKSGGATVALFAPDQMMQAGLFDDFDGRIELIRYIGWNYGNAHQNEEGGFVISEGKRDNYVLAVAVVIQPDDAEAPICQIYSTGSKSLSNWAPSQDADAPAGGDADTWHALANGESDLDDDERLVEGDYSGPFAVWIGDERVDPERRKLPKGTSFAVFCEQLGAANFADWADDGDLRALEGMYAHWNRVPPPSSWSKIQGGGDDRKANDILVVTEILELPGEGKKAAKGKAKSKAAPKSKAKASKAKEVDEDAGEESEGDDEGGMEAKVREVVRTALAKADDATMGRKDVEKVIRKTFKGRELVESFKLIKDDEWVAGQDDGGWIYDEDEEALTLLDE